MAAGLINFSIEDHFMQDRQFIDNNNKVFITLGARSYIGSSIIDWWGDNPHLLIGRYCSISRRINFLIGSMNHNYHNVTTYPLANVVKNVRDQSLSRGGVSRSNAVDLNRSQIIIGNDVWIGANVTLLSGIKIGNGAVIGTNSVVAKDIPPYAIAVGNPAKVIKYRFSKDLIHKFQAIQWWNWPLEKIAENEHLFACVEEFADKFYDPQLETYPTEPLSYQLLNQHNEGKKIYSFVADFRAKSPLWKRILQDYMLSLKSNDNIVLVVFLEREATEDNLNQLRDFVLSVLDSKNNPKIYFVSNPNGHFTPSILRQSDYFITTREFVCLNCIDFLYDTDVKIISALDGEIFPNEPHSVWN